MGFQIYRPSPILLQFVKHYWTIEICIPTGKEHIQRIVPSGLPELIFYLDNKPVSKDTNRPIYDKTVITGQLKGYYDMVVKGKLTLFSILFQPHGLSMFFDIPIGVLQNQNVALKDIIKDKVSRLETSLSKARTIEKRIDIVESFLINQLQKSKKKYEFDRIRHTIELINQSKGIINIDTLASTACLSRKQYERTFFDFVGTSPKQFLKIIRFQNAIHEKSKNNNTNLTTLTYLCGYYDQSHMTNDFTKLSGMTPKQYFSDCKPYSDYFQ
jgi:AraC-like DNA-binding protein